MEPLDVDSRRYRRLKARVPLRIQGGKSATEVTTLTVDVSTSGGSFELPPEQALFTVGETVQIEILLRNADKTFTTEATVRNITLVDADGVAPERVRIGVQFREALLLSEIAYADD